MYVLLKIKNLIESEHKDESLVLIEENITKLSKYNSLRTFSNPMFDYKLLELIHGWINMGYN
ncbi:hypothetical protein, partial [Candidatus Stoquefichus massiliensis]|uniref:hypothetical protein n=1 Tax=Candidatus Stoquefichus massiliensis TaxID=1470350 RepID=UPI001C9BED9B